MRPSLLDEEGARRLFFGRKPVAASWAMGEAAFSPITAKRVDKRIGTLVLGWKIEALIGWGASARVYRAKQANSNRVAAIKVISKPRSHIGYSE